MSTTILSNLINPEVMGNMISAELPKKLKARGYYKVDTTLTGKAGNTITIPQWGYIGSATDLAEGATGTTTQMTSSDKEYTVKKAVKNVELTDEAVLSGYGDPVGETTKQLRMSIEDKVDNDGVALLAGLTAGVTSTEELSYTVVCEALDELPDSIIEDENISLYLLVGKVGLSQLRKDPKFIDGDTETVKTGRVKMIAGCKVDVSTKLADGEAYILTDEALTAFIKRDVSLETGREVLAKKTLFSVDEHYVVAIEDTTKIVKITHKKPTAPAGS